MFPNPNILYWGESFLVPDCPTGQELLMANLTSKAWGESLSLFMSFVTRFPVSFSNGATFFLVFILLLIQLKKPFLLPDTFLTMWALAFLSPLLHVQIVSLYSLGHLSLFLLILCFYVSLLSLSFVRSLLFIHGGIVLPLLDFLHIIADCSWAWMI